MGEDIIWSVRSDRIVDFVKNGKRIDGRAFDEYRDITVDLNISENAEGSAKVSMGKTITYAGIKFIIGEPYPDSPDEGSISINAETYPISFQGFDNGSNWENPTELARVIDRGIRESKCIDFKELCLVPSESSLVAFCDVYPMNYDGNLFDSGALASIIAFKNVKLPKVEDKKIIKDEYSGSLKLKNIPILSTFVKVGDKLLVDPSLAEEKAASARFSVSTTDKGHMVAFQKGMSGSFSLEEINSAIDVAFKRAKDLRKFVK